MKLAQNQTELSSQISELKATVEMQGEMIRRLVEMLEGQKRKG
jgi:potassium voltage-gated channel Shal-related subfamily D member 2